MDELINLLNRNIHAMIRGDMPFKLKEVSPYVVYVDERKLFVDVVLSYVNVEMVESILVKS